MSADPRQSAPRPGRGSAGAATLRARIEREGFDGHTGPDAYRAYMRALRARAPSDLAAIGGRAAHRALLADLGEQGYRDRQRAGFDAACARHGRERILRHIRQAHAARRAWRLANPTPAEAALHMALISLGYHVHPITHAPGDQGFDYEAWRRDGSPSFTATDLVLEARAGAYFLDTCIPALGLAIEADGGVHQLRPQHDSRRRAWLARAGITLRTFTNDQVLRDGFAAVLAQHLHTETTC